MKTPKRYQDKPTPVMPEDSEPDWYVLNCWCQRAKRKNKIAQLKRTIARLTKELAAARESCDYLCAASIEYERCARALYEHIMRDRKKRPETAENGQQAELPPAGGQQDCVAQNAENAKQGNLLCTDAEQIETRKGN